MFKLETVKGCSGCYSPSVPACQRPGLQLPPPPHHEACLPPRQPGTPEPQRESRQQSHTSSLSSLRDMFAAATRCVRISENPH